MKPIKTLKLALMENQGNISDGKDSFIIRLSATLDVEKYLSKHKDDEETFVLNAITNIYEDLISKKSNNVDTVGLWVTLNNDTIIDNSMKIAILESIEKYSIEKIDAIQEFYKMTVNVEEPIVE